MTTATATIQAHAPPEFLLGGGDTGAFMRDIDWSITALGAPGSWPLNLSSSVGLCLNCSFPMLICWGPDRTTFFNDAFLPILGPRAAQALGAPIAESLPELWELLAPAVEQVSTTGDPVVTAFSAFAARDRPRPPFSRLFR